MEQTIYRKDDEGSFWSFWQQFLENNEYTYRYLEYFINYMRIESKYLVEDLSFVFVENGECVAIAYIPIERYNTLNIISHNLNFSVAPIYKKNSKIEKKIFKTIEEIVTIYNVQKVMFQLDPLLNAVYPYNYLLQYGFIDCSSLNAIIDLTQNDEVLWNNMNYKKTKRIINKFKINPDITFHIMDMNNLDYDLHEQYRKMHAACAGGVTRPKDTFDLLFKMVEEGNAILTYIKYQDKIIGFLYNLIAEGTASFASACNDPQYEYEIPIYRILYWNTILYLKKLNLHKLQIGAPFGFESVMGFGYYLNEKHLEIANFKLSMGAVPSTHYRGVKYYNSDLFLEDLNRFQVEVINVLNKEVKKHASGQ